MNEPSFLGLVQNIALLLALVLLFDILIKDDRHFSVNQAAFGVVIGGIGVFVMMTPWVLMPGVIFDTRSVLLSVSGLIFGGLPTLIAMAITAAYRIYQGGSGVLTGVLVILASGSIGIAWRSIRKQPLVKTHWGEFYLFGLITHLVVLALMLTFPWEVAKRVLTNISLPILVMYPLGTVLLGVLMANRNRREQAQAELAETSARLNATQQLTKMGAWEWDMLRQSMFWADEVYRIHGFPIENFSPNSPEHRAQSTRLFEKSMLCYDLADRALVQQAFQNCFEKGQPYDLELPFSNVRGERLWVNTRAEAVIEQGRVVRVLGSIMDITERKRAEEALRESEQKYRTVADFTYDWEAWRGPDGVYRYVSPACERISGRTVADFLATPGLMVQITHPDDRSKVRAHYSGDDQESQLHDLEFDFRILTLNGEIRWLSHSCTAVYAEDGQYLGRRESNRDITERKRVDYALRASEAEYRRIVETALEGIIVLDSQFRMTLVNQQMAAMLGYTIEELLGQKFAAILDEAELGDHQAQMDLRRHGQGSIYERCFRRKDGEKLWAVVSAKARFDLEPEDQSSFGRFAGSFAMISDITERKRAEEKIKADQIELKSLLSEAERSRRALLSVVEDQKDAEEHIRRLYTEINLRAIELEQRVAERTAQLTSANREMEAFSYSVSHDLRAPLRALDGFSAALMSDYQESLDAQGQHYLTRIQEASRRMGQLIDDMLNLSRITRREMKLERLDLSVLARQIAAELQALAGERQVEFVIAADLVVRADPNLMKILLDNFLRNAFKFTSGRAQARIEFGMLEAGSTPVPAGSAPALKSGVEVFFVRDNGVGFNMAYADKLFTPFQRLHSAQEFPGTGIGLSIVQRIIARHGGSVWPEAVQGEGATFYFSLPRE